MKVCVNCPESKHLQKTCIQVRYVRSKKLTSYKVYSYCIKNDRNFSGSEAVIIIMPHQLSLDGTQV